MPSAEIITIGTEILLGEISDSNSQFLARALRDTGIDLFRITSVGDNVERIARAIREAMQRCDVIITTGGLGPTVDDPTRDAVARALDVKSIFRPELWEQINSRFKKLGRTPTDNNRRQAYIPDGAVAIENPVGTAPIFIIEQSHHILVALPGVPSEMRYLLQSNIVPYLRQYYNLRSVIKTRVLHTVGVGESQVDDLIGDLEELSNPTVGLAAHSGQVDVRITVKAESESKSSELIEPIETVLRERLGKWIYGVDQDTLEDIALQSVSFNHWTLVAVEAGLGGNMIRRLSAIKGVFIGGQVVTEPTSLDELIDLTDAYRHFRKADVGLGVALLRPSDILKINQVLITPRHTSHYSRSYGGPPEYAPLWAFNQSMDLIRGISHDS